MAEQEDDKRTAGWLPLTHLSSRGDAAFKETLERALSRTGRVDRFTHGFHTYPAGLHPDAAVDLLELMPPGPIHDPFCGGGTTLVEAMLQGRDASGTDISPVAVALAHGRTRMWSPERITAFRSAARQIAKTAQHNQDFPPDEIARRVKPWYQPHVAQELEGIRQGIQQAHPDVRKALELVLSSILVKVSLRRSDTNPQRVDRERPPGTTAILFHKKARELGRRWEALNEAVPEGTAVPRIRQGSGLELDPPGPVAGLLTSPPYPGVYDYLEYQQLRLAWLGWDSPEIWQQEMGSRRAFKNSPREALYNWKQDIEGWMHMVARWLLPGGRAAIVIGDGLVDSRLIPVLKPLRQAAGQAGLRVLGSASGGREDKGAHIVREEHILLLEKEG